MNTLEPLEHEGELYYSLKELKQTNKYPEIFFGTAQQVAVKFIKKYKPTEKDYVYYLYNKKTDEWTQSNNTVKQAQMFIKETFFNDLTKQKPKYELAPPLLELDENEFQLFRNEKGKVIPITMRGERHPDKIWFKVKDISQGFNIPNLDKSLSKEQKTSYIETEDYKTFIIETNQNDIINNNDQCAYKTELYLTYNGILKVLFLTKIPDFTQFYKYKLIGFINYAINNKNNFLQIYYNQEEINKKYPQSCIYVYQITTDKNENTYNYYMYGKTINFTMRNTQHQLYFNKQGKKLHLIQTIPVQPQYISYVETSLKHYLQKNKIFYEDQHSHEQFKLNISDKNTLNTIIKYIQFLSEVKVYANKVQENYKKYYTENQQQLFNFDDIDSFSFLESESETEYDTSECSQKNIEYNNTYQELLTKYEQLKERFEEKQQLDKNQYEQLKERFDEMKKQHEREIVGLKKQHEQELKYIKENYELKLENAYLQIDYIKLQNKTK